jgi:hypothetical protein
MVSISKKTTVRKSPSKKTTVRKSPSKKTTVRSSTSWSLSRLLTDKEDLLMIMAGLGLLGSAAVIQINDIKNTEKIRLRDKGTSIVDDINSIPLKK